MRRITTPQMLVATRLLVTLVALAGTSTARAQPAPVEHRVLATSKTSTMEKELNAAAAAGFRFQAVMGGESAFGGKEVMVVLSRTTPGSSRFTYKLLATNRTSTMQKEIQEAADAGYQYRAQTVFSSAFGGDEVVVLLERDNEEAAGRFEYRLLATSKTSTLEKELKDAGEAGYTLVGLTVGNTALGGKELVAITRRMRQ